MEIQISRQLALFGQSVLLGLTAGLLYDLLRSFRLRLPRSWGAIFFSRVGWALSSAAWNTRSRASLRAVRSGAGRSHTPSSRGST